MNCRLTPSAGRPRPSIVEVTATDMAGLNDRRNFLQQMGNIAGSLGARLSVPRPCRVLQPAHNSGMPLNCSIGWWRYVHLTFLDDGSRVIHDPEKRKLHAIQGGSVVQQFQRAARLSRPFVWSRAFYYDDISALHAYLAQLRNRSGIPRLNHRAEGCTYVAQRTSKTVEELRGRFLRALKLTPRLYVTLHLRRGDATSLPGRFCDTEVPKVVSYVVCSSSTNPLHENAALPLLIFTDERDPGYVEALTTALRALTTPGGDRRFSQVFRADSVLEQLASESGMAHDNFLVFAASVAVQELGGAYMQMRHKSAGCDCYHSTLENMTSVTTFQPFRR